MLRGLALILLGCVTVPMAAGCSNTYVGACGAPGKVTECRCDDGTRGVRTCQADSASGRCEQTREDGSIYDCIAMEIGGPGDSPASGGGTAAGDGDGDSGDGDSNSDPGGTPDDGAGSGGTSGDGTSGTPDSPAAPKLPGQDETCPADTTCEFDCGDGNCDVTCEDGTTCQARCAGGNCDLVCGDDSVCALFCAGGGCSLTCGSDSVCSIHECPSGECECSGC